MMLATSISLSGLQAQRLRLHASAHNIANLNTDDFKSQRIELVALKPGGVGAYVSSNETKGPLRFDPTTGETAGQHSNTDLVHEVVTQLTAQRAYEANLTAIESGNELLEGLFERLG